MYQIESDGETLTVVSEVKIMKCLTEDGESVIVTYSGELGVAEIYGMLHLEAERFKAKWEH